MAHMLPLWKADVSGEPTNATDADGEQILRAAEHRRIQEKLIKDHMIHVLVTKPLFIACLHL